MAKRKRLTPAAPTAAPEAPLETKARTPFGATAPIAQVAGDAAAQAALAEMSGLVSSARAEGRLIQSLPLDRVEADHLVRDRIAVDDEDMQALLASLRARGQQMPIEVVELPADANGPRYGLISGWRRLTALRELALEGVGDGTVSARIRQPEGAPEAYVAMVEENEIRASLSHYERARIVVRAEEAGVFPDRQAALRGLFGNVSRAKRSKIRAFTLIVRALDADLSFPTRIGERLGLALAQKLDGDPAFRGRLAERLAASAPETVEAEQTVIAEMLSERPPRDVSEPPKALRVARTVKGIHLVYDEARQRITMSGEPVTEELLSLIAAWLESQ